MAAVHVTTTPCEPHTGKRYIFFSEIPPCINNIMFGRLEACCAFYERFKGFRTLRIMGKCANGDLFRYQWIKDSHSKAT